MKRVVLFVLAVLTPAIGGSGVAHADAGAGCWVRVPNPPLIGGWPPFCSDAFFVADEAPYTIRLDAGSAVLGYPGSTGEFRAQVSRGTQVALDIRARFVAGVLVDGTESLTADLGAGTWRLSVWYPERPVIAQCVGGSYPICVRAYPGIGGAIGSVGRA